MSTLNPESTDTLFSHERAASLASIPQKLHRASFRLSFPPSYILVGAYRLLSDPLLYKPAWEKCKHGTIRGLGVGLVWTVMTWGIQKKFIEIFLSNSARVTGLSKETSWGFTIPFSLSSYAAFLLVGTQVSYILTFFLYRNIRIARDRAYQYTVLSRSLAYHQKSVKEKNEALERESKGETIMGQEADFWGPYVEEWDSPPVPKKEGFIVKMGRSFLGRTLIRLAIGPINLWPFAGMCVSAYLKGLSVGPWLHKSYFQAKKMNEYQIAVFVEERKWSYRLFGFAASLLEGLPFIGVLFSVSNRVGAAMWAYDLEKMQKYVAEQKGLTEKREL